MKAKWMTILMAALFSGAFAVGAVASDVEMDDSQDSAYQEGEEITLSQVDTNGDGVIDEQEASGHPALSADFQDLDENGDGKLDQAEFARFETEEGQAMSSSQSESES